MTSAISLSTNPEEVYNKLIDINGINSFGLAMTYFDSLYSFKDFWSKRHPYGLSPKTFTTYVEFARYEVPWGLGWDIDVIKAHCKRKPNIWQEHEEQINPMPKHGINQHNVGCSNLSPIELPFILPPLPPYYPGSFIPSPIQFAEGSF